MKEFINSIVVFINNLTPIQQTCLLAVFAGATIFGFYWVVKDNYNAKKTGIKLGSIIFTIILLAITIFIISCL